MVRFEDRLAAVLAALLGTGCGGPVADGGGTDSVPGTSDTGPATLDPATACDGTLPPNYLIAQGFVEIDPGGTCPEPADAQLSINPCVFIEWQGITCDFIRVDPDQVLIDDGYGGHFASAATVPTSYTGAQVGPVVDVCWYDGVYYDDPQYDTTCGRPLLDDGVAVVAAPRVGRADWSGPANPSELAEDERAEVAAYWRRCALLEHASVASFACFSLDLMRFGAPPELVAAAHRAALDEIEHAKLCFALAGRDFGGVGPGPLEVPAGAAGRARVDVVEALVREGCVGETIAAVDAAARLARATDPSVRAALQVIARDEAVHAALAWRALDWFLADDRDGELRARVDAVLEDERSRGGDGKFHSRETAWSLVIQPAWEDHAAAA